MGASLDQNSKKSTKANLFEEQDAGLNYNFKD